MSGSAVSSVTEFRKSILFLCAFAGLISLLALVGWLLHIPLLVGIFPEAATMKPNTALSLLLLAGAIATRQAGRRASNASFVLALAAVLLTGTTLAEYAFARSFGIDQMLTSVPAESAGDPLGRMSEGTAIAGLLSGLSILLIELLPRIAPMFAALAGLLSLSALVGFLFDAGPLLGVPLLRSMAVRTAASFAALQLAYFLMRPQKEPTRSLLLSARHHVVGGGFAIGTCLLPLLLGWPVAMLFRRGRFNAPFAFAILVVLLMVLQAILVSRNSRSLAEEEDKRDLVEEHRKRLEKENERQNRLLRASELRAAQSEALYRLITDALPALVSYVDCELRYIRANGTYGTWFGIAPSYVEGRTIDEVLGPAADEIRMHLQRALNGEPQQFETRLHTMQGERIVSISHIPDADPDGSIRGVIVHANDITATRKNEAALRQTEKLAAVGKLASSIAHEINNPLESVTNLLYLAKTSAELHEVREYLETAEHELHRVSAIATQTLRFHKQTTRPSPVCAEELFESVLAIYRPRLRGRILLEETHRAADPLVCKDGEIRQVLNNLVGNAIDAMKEGPGRLIVRSRAARCWTSGERGVAFIVADTGSGMSSIILANIFEAFFTTKGVTGTGLGLWVSKEIIDRHGGRLHVRSSQEDWHHGTVFRLFLPYPASEPTAPAPLLAPVTHLEPSRQ